VNTTPEKTELLIRHSTDDRCVELARMLAVHDWVWLSANIRRLPVVLAAEAVHARLEVKASWLLGMSNRQFIAAALHQPGQPCELLQYWLGKYGRNIPQPVKRGIADAATRLWDEKTALQYDTNLSVRFADVLELCHPKTTWQVLDADGDLVTCDSSQKGRLFQHLITSRKNRKGYQPPLILSAIRERFDMDRCDAKERHAIAGRALNRDPLAESQLKLATAGQPAWLISWLRQATPRDGTALTDRQQYTLAIPHMGYETLLSCLPVFDRIGLGPSMVNKIQRKICDPGEVQAAGLLPFRLLSEYLNAPTEKWARSIEQALQVCIPNIPPWDNRTLVLIDVSGSMAEPMEHWGGEGPPPRRLHAAVLFAAALAMRNETTSVYGFADGVMKIENITEGPSIIKTMEFISGHAAKIGLTSRVEHALRDTYDKHDRVIILSDVTAMYYDAVPEKYLPLYQPGAEIGDVNHAVPPDVHVHGFNLKRGTFQVAINGDTHRHELPLDDQVFTLVPMIEAE
jgi:hypothetical protein